MYAFECVHIRAVLLEVAVRRRDTGNVGAVLALRVMVVGDVEVDIDVVIAKGDLFVDVKLLRRQIAGGLRVGVELFQNGSGVRRRHEAVAAAVFGLVLGDGVCKGVGIKGLMVNVQARIDDRNAHACAVVALEPARLRTGHLAGDGGMRLIGAADGNNVRKIAGLLHNAVHTVHRGDLLDRAARHVRGNDVCRKRQIPHNVHLAALERLTLDALTQLVLCALKARAILHRAGVFGDVFRREARIQRGRVLQHDGNTHHFILLHVRLAVAEESSVVGVAEGLHDIHRFGELQLVLCELLSRQGNQRVAHAAFRCQCGAYEAGGQHKRQKQGKESGELLSFHDCTSRISVYQRRTVMFHADMAYKHYTVSHIHLSRAVFALSQKRSSAREPFFVVFDKCAFCV